jgi:hypothetical protein
MLSDRLRGFLDANLNMRNLMRANATVQGREAMRQIRADLGAVANVNDLLDRAPFADDILEMFTAGLVQRITDRANLLQGLGNIAEAARLNALAQAAQAAMDAAALRQNAANPPNVAPVGQPPAQPVVPPQPQVALVNPPVAPPAVAVVNPAPANPLPVPVPAPQQPAVAPLTAAEQIAFVGQIRAIAEPQLQRLVREGRITAEQVEQYRPVVLGLVGEQLAANFPGGVNGVRDAIAAEAAFRAQEAAAAEAARQAAAAEAQRRAEAARQAETIRQQQIATENAQRQAAAIEAARVEAARQAAEALRQQQAAAAASALLAQQQAAAAALLAQQQAAALLAQQQEQQRLAQLKQQQSASSAAEHLRKLGQL